VGKRGPPPKPDALKKFEGTYRKDRSAAGALELPPGVPPCPKGLPADARAIWAELAGNEKWRIVLATADAFGLELLVKHMALERKYARAAQRQPIVKTPFGPKPNPAASEARKEGALVKQLLAEFGLTPSARSRVGKPAAGSTPGQGAPSTDGTPLVGPPLRAIEGGKAGG
jgi:P27 family predicted phage terminase small subunit